MFCWFCRTQWYNNCYWKHRIHDWNRNWWYRNRNTGRHDWNWNGDVHTRKLIHWSWLGTMLSTLISYTDKINPSVFVLKIMIASVWKFFWIKTKMYASLNSNHMLSYSNDSPLVIFTNHNISIVVMIMFSRRWMFVQGTTVSTRWTVERRMWI